MNLDIYRDNSTLNIAERHLTVGKKLIFCLGADVNRASIITSTDKFAGAVDGQPAPVACCHAIMCEIYQDSEFGHYSEFVYYTNSESL